MDVLELLAAEERAWSELSALFAQIPVELFEQPSVTPGGWSPKDVMFHIGAWMADCGLQLERMRAGTFSASDETRESIERQNAEWFELSRTMDPVDVRAEFAAARLRMVEDFGTLPQVTADAREWFEESGVIHYAKHVSDLQAWLAKMLA